MDLNYSSFTVLAKKFFNDDVATICPSTENRKLIGNKSNKIALKITT